jgi:general secretion pathway protein E
LDGQVRKALGCPRCRNTGYVGRTVISEALVIDDRFRELVVVQAPYTELKAHAQKITAQSMRDRAIELVASGRTSLNEVERVLAFD